MGRMVTSGSLGGVIVTTIYRNARDVSSIPALGEIFPIFITPTTVPTDDHYRYIHMYTVKPLNRPTTGPTLCGSFREVVGLG